MIPDNCIHQLQDSFDHDLLINMAMNDNLPYVFRAEIIGFMSALVIDREPQKLNCGTAHLPEQLWIFNDSVASKQAGHDHKAGAQKGSGSGGGVSGGVSGGAIVVARRSTTPIVHPQLRLETPNAFPLYFHRGQGRGDYFFEVDTKFFLLRILCNSELGSTSGAIVHKDEAQNLWTEALIESQRQLLLTGFQSVYYKLDGLCKANADILDGRNDLHQRCFNGTAGGTPGGTPFDPPEKRYEVSLSSNKGETLKATNPRTEHDHICVD